MTTQEQQDALRNVALPIVLKGISCPFDPDVLQHALNVNRRTCTRQVPMKLLVLGLSRTGTASLRHALFELGYFDVYHGSSFCSENPRDCQLWVNALRGKYEGGKKFEKKEWDALLGHSMAVMDTPGYAFAEELIDAYPEAKVILTVRDSAEAWKRSMMSTVLYTVEQTRGVGIVGKVVGWFAPPWTKQTAWYQPMFEMVTKYTKLMEVPERGEEMYEEHNAWVKRLMKERGRAEELLVYNVKQGWEPLCRFLGQAIPIDKESKMQDFLRMNSEEGYLEKNRDFQRSIARGALKSMMAWVCGPIMILLLGVWLRW